METLILSYFDIKEGPKIFLKVPKNIPDEEFDKIPLIMNLYDKGFFIHMFDKYKSANLIFNIPSQYVRGKKELLSISLVVDLENDIDLNLSRDLLEGFAKELHGIDQAYKAFHLDDDNREKFMDDYVNIKHAFLTFFRNLQPAIKAINLAELRYRHLFVSSPNMLLLLDYKGKVVDANPSYMDYFSYKLEDIQGKDFREQKNIKEHTLILYNEIFKQVREKQIVDGLEIQLSSKEGSEKWMSLEAYVFEIKDNKLILVRMTDITDRVKAQHRLEKSEEKYRSILENIHEGYYETDLKGNYTFFNDRMTEILGFTKFELTTKNYKDIVSEADANWIFDTFNQVYKEKKENDIFNFQYERGDGIIVYLESTINLKRDNKGNKVGFYGLTRDISEKLFVERKLRESEAKYKVLFKGGPIPTFAWQKIGDDFVLVDFNFAAEKETRGHIREWLGKTLEEAFPNGHQMVEDIKQCYETSSSYAKNVDLYLDMLGKEKELRVIYNHVPPHLILVHTEDVSQVLLNQRMLQESEEKYRLITEHAEDLIVVLDNNFNIDFINEHALKKSMGYEKEDILSKSALLFIHPEDIQKAQSAFIEGFTEGYTKGEIRLKNKNDKWVSFQIKGVTFKTSKGIKKVLVICRDITSIKYTQHQIKKSEERYKFIVENVTNLVLLFNQDYKIIYFNKGVHEKVLGYTKEDVKAMTLFDFIHPKDLESAKANLSKPYKEREETIELRLKQKSGLFVRFEIKGRVIKDEGGNAQVLLIGNVVE